MATSTPLLFADASRGRPFSKDPAVVRHDGRYLLYYSAPPWADGRQPDGWRIGVAEGDDVRRIDRFEKIGELDPVQPCEVNGLCAAGATVIGGRVHLFYQTYGNGPEDAICHAVSDDGVNFDRNPFNPVLRAPVGQGWNNGRAIDADAVDAGDGRLMLYYATRDPTGAVQMLGAASAVIDSAFGPATWRHEGDGPILRPELPWEQKCIEAAAVVRRGGRWFLFYGGAYNCQPQQIGCAAGDDGVRFTRLSDRPLLPHGPPGSWNASESGHPFVFTDDDGSTHLFYQGSPDGGRTWFLSRATIEWDGGRLSIVHD